MLKQPPLQERVRQRLRDLVAQRGVSHEVLGKYLGLSRSATTRLLNDENNGIGFQHFERLCEFFQLTPCELLNSPTAVIQEIKPLEAQLLVHFRAMSELQRHGLLAVLEHRQASEPKRRRRARLGHAELTEEQQLIVDLYARSDATAREGVLKVLRGTAAHEQARQRLQDDRNE